MSNLFDYKDVRNRVSRDGFDLSRRFAFTAKAGELLPVCTLLTVPNSTYRIKSQHFTRTSPVQSAAFVRIREYFDWYWAPFRLFWKQFQPMITQMDNNPVMASSFMSSRSNTDNLPYLGNTDLSGAPVRLKECGSPTNTFGQERGALSAKLMSYIGYFKHPMMVKFGFDKSDTPKLVRQPVNIMPLALYHKAYNDYYRNQQWEVASPYLWNFDYSEGGQLLFPDSASSYWNGKTLFDMEYSNWNKDMIMGLLPSAQYGDTAEVNVILGSANVSGASIPIPSSPVVAAGKADLVAQPVSSQTPQNAFIQKSNLAPFSGSEPLQTLPSTVQFPASFIDRDSFSASISILALRQQQMLQKYREIQQSGNQDYQDQMYKIWGVRLSPSLSDKCMYVDGSANNLDISEIINTNFSDAYDESGSPLSAPWVKGKGVGVGESTTKFSADEFGVLMCLYHCQPLLDYDTNMTDLTLLAVNQADFPNPIFDRIGMEEMPYMLISNDFSNTSQGTASSGTVGYGSRYLPWKSALDRVSGDFSFTLKDWVAPLTDDYFSKFYTLGDDDDKHLVINHNWFKVNPSALDNIFGVAADSFVTSDQFRVNSYFDIKAVLPFDYNGLPY